MNVKITKNIEEANAITHGGSFHADEVFATVILSKLKPLCVSRVLQVEDIKPDTIVYDIGGKEFDHHQTGGNGKREDNIKYASCGLIWKRYGKELLEKVYNIDKEKQETLLNLIDTDFIKFIDANDNGQIENYKGNCKIITIATIISYFNPSWNSSDNQDECFLKAVEFAEIVFDKMVKEEIAKMQAKELVEKAIDEAQNGILKLSKFMPWKEFLLLSTNPKAKQVQFVVFPSNREGYDVYAVPVKIGSFENRKSFPKEWAGLRDEELKKVTKVETAKFCHNGRFLCVADNMQDAMQLAKIAISNND